MDFAFWPDNWAQLDHIKLSLGKTRLSLADLIDGVLLGVILLVGTLWFTAWLERRLLAQAVNDLSLRKIIGNVLRALLLFVSLLLVLSTLGVDLTALSVIGGAVGVGLGFGLQKLAANYVSGFVILIERSLQIGDFVRVDNFEGRVVDIKTRYTLLRNSAGTESVVPNERLLIERVENLAKPGSPYLMPLVYWLSHDTAAAPVKALLEQAAAQVEGVRAEPAPTAWLQEVTPQGLRWTLLVWLNDPTQQGPVRSQVHLSVLAELKAAGLALTQLPPENTVKP